MRKLEHFRINRALSRKRKAPTWCFVGRFNSAAYLRRKPRPYKIRKGHIRFYGREFIAGMREDI